jgi:hypothetical protein
MFARLKDWRTTATSYDDLFLFAICSVAIVMYWF